MTTACVPLIDQEHARILEGGVSVIASSCDADMLPCLTRGVGCKVAADLQSVTIFVVASQSVKLLEDIRQSGAIAVVFDIPSTHWSMQLKGRDTRARALESGELALVEAYRNAFVQELHPLGYSPLLIRAALGCDAEDIVALDFTPCAAFSQTPGPRAGEPLQVRS